MTSNRLPRLVLPLALSTALALSAVAAPAVAGQQAAPAQSTAFATQLVKVDTPRPADKSTLTNLGLDLTEHAGPGFVEVVLHSVADADTLREAGLSYRVEIPDLALRTAQNNKLSKAYAESVPTSPLPT